MRSGRRTKRSPQWRFQHSARTDRATIGILSASPPTVRISTMAVAILAGIELTIISPFPPCNILRSCLNLSFSARNIFDSASHASRLSPKSAYSASIRSISANRTAFWSSRLKVLSCMSDPLIASRRTAVEDVRPFAGGAGGIGASISAKYRGDRRLVDVCEIRMSLAIAPIGMWTDVQRPCESRSLCQCKTPTRL
jgi:hypothetical protein